MSGNRRVSGLELSEQRQKGSDKSRKTTIQQDCWYGREKQRSREKQQLKTPYHFIRQAWFVAEHPLHIHKIKEEYYRWQCPREMFEIFAESHTLSFCHGCRTLAGAVQ